MCGISTHDPRFPQPSSPALGGPWQASHLGLAHLSFLEVTVSLAARPMCRGGAKTWKHGELHDKNLGKGVELEPMNILKMLNEMERAERNKTCWPIRNLKIADSKMKKLTKERWIFTTGAGDVFCFEQSWFHENHLCCMCFMFFQVFPRRNPMAKSNFVSECRPHDWLKS